jgi:hypothetical protein
MIWKPRAFGEHAPLGRDRLARVLDRRDTNSVLAALLRRRAEVEGWIDGPVKKVTLTAIDRMIADLEQEVNAA